jgi:hypothetical protein
MTYSASTVSHSNEIVFRDLYSVCVGIRFPTAIKLKVRLKQKKIEAIFLYSFTVNELYRKKLEIIKLISL